MNNEFILTIAIPTYNRSQYLDLCLSQICKQLNGIENRIELLISDNCSTDNTHEVVRKYIDQGFQVRYMKNDLNIGPDRNNLMCFQKAEGKYVLIFGDDDVLLDGGLNKIIKILNSGEYGVVFLRSYGFKENFNDNKPKQTPGQSQTKVYEDIDDFIDEVNYWVTYISGNIVNKSLLKDRSDFERFLDTNINQLSWVFAAILKARKNVVVNERLIAQKDRNARVFHVCKIFGTDMNNIMQAFVEEGLPRKSVVSINNKMLFTLFPASAVALRSNGEDYFRDLYPVYKSYFFFWFNVAPLTRLPLPLAIAWLFFVRVINKLSLMIGTLRSPRGTPLSLK